VIFELIRERIRENLSRSSLDSLLASSDTFRALESFSLHLSRESPSESLFIVSALALLIPWQALPATVLICTSSSIVAFKKILNERETGVNKVSRINL
jgi:hypothetical protein